MGLVTGVSMLMGGGQCSESGISCDRNLLGLSEVLEEGLEVLEVLR